MTPKKPTHVASPHSMRILVVDDTRVSRCLIASLVRGLGHQFEMAANGKRAWQLACKTYPDLIVTDLEMPVWSGFDLINAIRSTSSESLRLIPIVVCSTRGDELHLNRAIEMGADAFVTKPVHANELRLAIQNAVLASVS